MADFETSDPSDPGSPRPESASERLREVSFPLAVRGYERAAVDDFVDAVRALVAELEAGQTREGVVQRALDEVGVETASILQNAHETADEITSRSRAQADDRVQRAQEEAEMLRRDADEYSEQVVVDTRLLWEERQRLIEDIRQLADEVLATADDAMERVKMPEPLAAADVDSDPGGAEAPISGPVGVPAMEPDGPGSLDQGEEYAGLGAVEEEPPEGESPAYEPEEGEPYDSGGPDQGSPEDQTAPHRIGAAEDELPPEGEERFPQEDESGHTVELEALPGGGGEEPVDPDEPPHDH
jgi:DivIVA domain-containing protein